MDFLPYLERMGAGAGVIFFALYLREALKRDAITKQLIELLPQAISAMVGVEASIESMREMIRDRRNVPKD